MQFRLSVPPENLFAPERMRQALAGIHGAMARHEAVTLGIGELAGTVGLFCEIPEHERLAVEALLHAAYPDAKIETVPDDSTGQSVGSKHSMRLRLAPDVFPILRFSQFPDDDPVGGILEAIASLKQSGLSASVEFAVRPAGARHRRRVRRTLKTLASEPLRRSDWLKRIYEACVGNSARASRLLARIFEAFATSTDDRREDMLATSARRGHDAEHRLQAASDKQSRHLFETTLTITVRSDSDREIPDSALQQVAASLERFTVPGLATFQRVRSASRRPFDRRSTFLLSDEELATLWHPPLQNARSSRQHVAAFRELEPPVDLPVPADDPSLSIIGRVCFRGRNELFGIRTEDRLRHLAILGKTGMGKTTLLRSLITSDIAAGRGVAVIDPHGDLAEDIAQAVPPSRSHDVVLFDAGNRRHPLAFNPLVCPNRDERPLRASGIVTAFRKLFAESWGPRLEHILRFSILALIETPGTSLADVAPLLTDAGYRRDLVGRLKDPVVRDFFTGEFHSWNDRYRTEAVAPILNKVGQFIANPILRGILAQRKSKLDLRRIMDDGRILIVNLSKGRVGEDGSSLLGSLLVTCLQQAAMSRASIPESDRRDFFLYIDEFQNLSTESFATILSEARKYHLGLILANQYLDQIDDHTRSAVFGNVGSLLTFNLGSTDAETIANQLGPDLTPRDLMSLPKFTAYARLLINGQATPVLDADRFSNANFRDAKVAPVCHSCVGPDAVCADTFDAAVAWTAAAKRTAEITPALSPAASKLCGGSPEIVRLDVRGARSLF